MKTQMVVTRTASCPIGTLHLAATDRGVCWLGIEDEPELSNGLAQTARRHGWTLTPDPNEHVDLLADELEQYFAGALTDFSAKLDLHGTAFQRRVWQALRRVPYGCTTSYGELARRAGYSGASRAVGQANHRNPVAIVVPCHRVIQADGTLGGYGGGLWRKSSLLQLEGVTIGARTAATVAR